MSELVKKYKVAPFINTGTSAAPVWTRIKKSTSFDLNLNPETQDFEYISDEIPTTELMRYKPSLSLPITMYKGEADYELAFDKFYNLKTGSDAKAELLLVFFMEKETEETTTTDETSGEEVTVTISKYKAWKTETVLSVQNLNSVDSTITVQTDFSGSIKRGYASKSDDTITFTASADDDANSDDALTW
ncbi:MAG: hypothetical protein K6G80_00085 [Treponema sp.]|nr:hypothetical protein [Treponema sp.]